MGDILLIDEDDEIKKKLQIEFSKESLEINIKYAKTYKEAFKIIESCDIKLILISLNDNDEDNNICLNNIDRFNIPLIAIIDKYDSTIQKTIYKHKIFETIIRKQITTIEYLMRLIHVLCYNPNTKILIIDEKTDERKAIANVINSRFPFEVMHTDSGDMAESLVTLDTNFKIVIIDSSLNKEKGERIIKKIRKNRTLNELSIIGIASKEKETTLMYLKAGANDFIVNPMCKEEVVTRIIYNIEILDNIQRIKKYSSIDYLTKLYNRKFLFESGEKLYAHAQRKHLPIAVGMIDLDFFKNINDKYGHDAGDYVLKEIAKILKNNIREDDIVARYGGEEFCFILNEANKTKAIKITKKIRQIIQDHQFLYNGEKLQVTASIGLACKTLKSLEQMIKVADDYLYHVKQNGRNNFFVE